MTEPRQDEISPGLLAGRLEGVSLPDLLWALCRGRKTGVLTVDNEAIRRSVYFDDGRIVFGSSTSPDDRLGEQFLRQGLITLDQLDDAVSQLHSGKRLGTLLVEAGSLAPEHLVEGVLGQVKAIVLDLFDWEHGEYGFDEGGLPTEEVITLNMRTGELLLEGIHSIRSFRRIRRSVGPLRTVYGLSPEGREAMDGLVLSEGEELLVVRLEQGDATVENLCQEVFLSNFEIYQSLWGLAVLGVIEQRADRLVRSQEAAIEGNLAERELAEVLVELGRSGQDGVLYLSHRSLERSFHMRHGRCVFATSNDPDDGLLAYLLRRGVISLRDKEETEKRLLSNKRVGTILLEMGVIDQRDLLAMVQEQLKEIVYDTFQWTEGDYAFVAGALPSVEEITLEPTLESLVAGGLQRVEGWASVKAACGEFDAPLELTPDYLDVLDAMRAGPQEWTIVTLLRSPSTPRQLCRLSELTDYRTCQIVSTLKRLGAVREAWAEIGEEVEESDAMGAEAASETQTVEIVELDREQARPVGQVAQDVAQVEEPEEAADPQAPESVDISKDATQAISPDAVAAAIRRSGESPPESSAEPDDTRYEEESQRSTEAIHGMNADEDASISPDTTQILSRDLIERALNGKPPQTGAQRSTDEHHEPQPGSGEPAGDPTASTMRMSRDEVEAALAAKAEMDQADEESDSEPFGNIEDAEQIDIEVVGIDERPSHELPDDVEQVIARFNSIQRVVYRTVKTEVGAGAANFVRSCASQLFEESNDPVAGAELRSDGSWEADDLKRVIVEQRISDPWNEYRRLLSQEIANLRAHISEAQVSELQQKLETLEQGEAPHN